MGSNADDYDPVEEQPSSGVFATAPTPTVKVDAIALLEQEEVEKEKKRRKKASDALTLELTELVDSGALLLEMELVPKTAMLLANADVSSVKKIFTYQPEYRNLIITSAKLEGVTAIALSQYLNAGGPNAVYEKKKDPFPEINLVKVWSSTMFEGMVGDLKPTQEMVNWFSKLLWEAKNTNPSFTPFPQPDFHKAPWVPVRDSWAQMVLREEASQRANKTKFVTLAPQHFAATYLRFTMAGHAADAWKTFGGFGLVLSNLLRLLDLTVTYSNEILHRYFYDQFRACALVARARGDSNIIIKELTEINQTRLATIINEVNYKKQEDYRSVYDTSLEAHSASQSTLFPNSQSSGNGGKGKVRRDNNKKGRGGKGKGHKNVHVVQHMRGRPGQRNHDAPAQNPPHSEQQSSTVKLTPAPGVAGTQNN